MNSLTIYDKENGLFKQVLKQSSVIKGNYHVSDNGGQNLNTNNLDTLQPSLKQDKYPIVVCLAPVSQFFLNDVQQKDYISFTLLFLTTTYYDANGTKSPSAATRKSTVEIWQDWQQMKQCAVDFIEKLKKLRNTLLLPSGYYLGTYIAFEGDSIVIRPISKTGTDRVSGVVATFKMLFQADPCEQPDYTDFDLSLINLT